MNFIGVPIDSVSRDGGAEHGPARLRQLGLADVLGGEDRGDLAVSIRGEDRDPETGILASADVLATTGTIRAAVAEQVGAGARPFLAGGCCAALPGALAGARDALGLGPAAWVEAAPQLIGASLGCYNPEKDPGYTCGRALVAALSRSLSG
jgi:arginase family enzyme